MSGIASAFQELFYGSGSWLGLLLLLTIIIILSFNYKYVSLLMLPVTIFLGIDYLNNSLMWNALIMFFASVFMVINLLANKKN